MNRNKFASDNGLSTNPRQAIIGTNADWLLIGRSWINNLKQITTIVNQENEMENIVCEVVAICLTSIVVVAAGDSLTWDTEV